MANKLLFADPDKLDAELKATADSIRAKGETTAPLDFYAGDFKKAVEALTGLEPEILVNAKIGATITCKNMATTLTKTATNGVALFTIPSFGEWTVTTSSGPQKTTVVVNESQRYIVDLICRLPNGYKELQYIKAPGTQYFATRSDLPAGTVIDFKFTPTEGGKMTAFFGLNHAFQNDQFELYMSSGNSLKFEQTYPGYAKSNDLGIVSISKTQTFRIEINPSDTSSFFYWNGREVLKFNNRPTPTGFPSYLLATNFSNEAKSFATGDAWEMSITDPTPGHSVHLVPCKTTSSPEMVGMYDLVSGTFKLGDGSGVFTPGPEVIG